MSKIFLGYPPPKIRQFIEEHYTDWTKVPLHFVAKEAGAKMSFHIADDGTFDEENGEFISNGNKLAEIQTSTDGKKWSDYTSDAEITLANVGDKVYFKAKTSNNTVSLGNNYIGLYSYSYFTIDSGKIAAKGNIMSLLDETCQRTDVPVYCYYNMFSDCSALEQAPALPATTLANHCYENMFNNCSSLTEAPKLPATTLADTCYNFMFAGCSALTTAPELPATTLADGCYTSMFSGCSTIAKAPELPATTLARWCYSYMFQNCLALTQAPELPATTLASGCYRGMFYINGQPLTISDKTFDEVADLIQNECLIGDYYWEIYDEETGEPIETINPVEIICSDKTMLATFDENEWAWTLTEK